jgi:hypothetical protein
VAERDTLRHELVEIKRERDAVVAAWHELRAASLARMKAEAGARRALSRARDRPRPSSGARSRGAAELADRKPARARTEQAGRPSRTVHQDSRQKAGRPP